MRRCSLCERIFVDADPGGGASLCVSGILEVGVLWRIVGFIQ